MNQSDLMLNWVSNSLYSSHFFYIPDAPTIEQEETFIHTGEGDETEVICIVHSSPKAEVTWFKDGKPLDPSTSVISQRGNRHTLMIPSVDKKSFGDYTCQARNQYGQDRKTTEVSGMKWSDLFSLFLMQIFIITTYQHKKFLRALCTFLGEFKWTGHANKSAKIKYMPYCTCFFCFPRFNLGLAGDVAFKSDPKGSVFDRYQLEWTAQSTTPITHFKVQWRPADKSASSSSSAASNQLWMERELRAVNLQRQFYAGDFTIPSLRPATVYLARVASKNAYGYNEFGEIFKFATKGAGIPEFRTIFYSTLNFKKFFMPRDFCMMSDYLFSLSGYLVSSWTNNRVFTPTP